MYTLQELAEKVGGTIEGDASCRISHVATIQNAGPESITFLSNRSYRKYLASTQASAVILRSEDLPECPVSAIVIDNPYLAYAKIASLLNPPTMHKPGIHPGAILSETAQVHPQAYVGPQVYVADGVRIGAHSYIGPGCVIEQGAEVGEGCRLVANITICHKVNIGNRVLIHPGVVIGSDGFGIANDQGTWLKVPQLGRVIIGDDVEIGANTTIDRGALEDTVIEEGVKLDNQIQVAHNVHIGAHTAIAGCVGIAGSAKIGKFCAIGGGAGIIGHLEIADHVQVTAMSLVTNSITEPGVYSSGTPLQPNQQWHRNYVRFRQLDDMAKRLRQLEKTFQGKSEEHESGK